MDNPGKKAKPKWLKHTSKEVEAIVVDLVKAGKEPAEIGMILRDQYGIPSVKLVTNKSLSTLIKEKGLAPELPPDLSALLKHASLLKKHLNANKKDHSAKRGFQLTESKIRRLVKYYKRKGEVPKDWKYSSKSL